MRFATVAVLGLALVASSFGGPIDIGTGLDLTPGDITFWSKDIVVGDQAIQVGVGWKLDGTIAAGAKVVAPLNGKQIPISAALSSNIKDLKNKDWQSIMYEVGANVEDTVSGIVLGDLSGQITYQVNAKVPTKGTGVTSVGASLSGSGETSTLVGGVAVGQKVMQAVLSLDGLQPTSFNIQVGDDAKLE